jgi:hypothetical protein
VVRLICLLKRKPELSAEQFREHWQTRHAPLIRSTATIARHVASYEQYLPADSPIPLGREFDGVTIMGFADSAAFAAFLAEPDYAAVIAPDERRFLDLEGLVGIMVDEPSTVIGVDEPSTVIGAPPGEGGR